MYWRVPIGIFPERSGDQGRAGPAPSSKALAREEAESFYTKLVGELRRLEKGFHPQRHRRHRDKNQKIFRGLFSFYLEVFEFLCVLCGRILEFYWRGSSVVKGPTQSSPQPSKILSLHVANRL